MAKKKRTTAVWLANNHDGTYQLFVSYAQPKLNHELNCLTVENPAALVACVQLPDLNYACAPGTCVELVPKTAVVGKLKPVSGVKCPRCRGVGRYVRAVCAQTRSDGVRIPKHKRSIECAVCEGVGICSQRAARRYADTADRQRRTQSAADS